MIISHNKYCIASKSFPLKFYSYNGVETDELFYLNMMSYEKCETVLKEFDDPEQYQILQVKVTFEI